MMNDDELRKTLRDLQQELLDRDDLDESQMVRLKQLRADIDEFLTQHEEHDIVKDLGDYVLERETEFSIDHPALATIFRETLNTLNRIGV